MVRLAGPWLLLWAMCCSLGRVTDAELAATLAEEGGGTVVDQAAPEGTQAPSGAPSAAEPAPLPPPDPGPAPGLAVVGRTLPLDPTDPVQQRFNRPGVRFGACWSGTGLKVTMRKLSDPQPTYFDVTVDGAAQPVVSLTGLDVTEIVLAQGLAPGEHEVWWMHRSEGIFCGSVVLLAVDVGAEGTLLPPPAVPARAIEVVGASADTGYGVDGSAVAGCNGFAAANPDKAWIQVAGDLVGARAYNSALSGMGIIANYRAEVAGPPAAIWPRADPTMATPTGALPADVGAWLLDCTENDWNNVGGSGLADPQAAQKWRAGVLKLMALVVAAYPEVRLYLVINCTVPDARRPVLRSLLGDTAAQAVAQGAAHASVMEFALDPNGSLSCDYHLNIAAHRAMGEQAAAVLKEDLGW